MSDIKRPSSEPSVIESAKSNKEWLLNRTAIRKAKECIVIIEQELGIRLKLTHPNFLEMIYEYAELTGSPALRGAFIELAEMAGIRFKRRTTPKVSQKVVPHPQMNNNLESSVNKSHYSNNNANSSDNAEVVYYQKKAYPKFNEQGQTFKGLYRGHPLYE